MKLLSDNGTSLNPSRRGALGQLVAHLARLGVTAITCKPYEPTTPPPGLPDRATPQTAREATPKADPPRPITQDWLDRSLDRTAGARFQHPRIDPRALDLPAGTRLRIVASAATIVLGRVTYKLDPTHAFTQVLIVTDSHAIAVTDLKGEVLAEFSRPTPE